MPKRQQKMLRKSPAFTFFLNFCIELFSMHLRAELLLQRSIKKKNKGSSATS